MRKPRAIALMLVLVLTSLLAMLSAALFSILRSNTNSFEASRHQIQAKLAARGAVAFVVYRLEQDPNWGKTPFTATAVGAPDAKMDVRQLAGTHQIEGLIDSLSEERFQTFAVDIENNLELAARPLEDETIPADSVWLKVTGWSGGFACRADVLYRPAPLYDSSILANKQLQISGHKRVLMSSNDPLRNWVRSNESVTLGNFYGSGANESLRFERVPGRPQGVVWARQDIKSPLGLLRGKSLVEAQRASDGIFKSRARRSLDIPKLKREDFTSPDQQAASLPAGSYYVGERPVTWSDSAGKHQETVRYVTFYQENTRKPTIYYDGRRLPPTLPPAAQEQIVVPGGIATFGKSTATGGPALTFSFEDNVFRIPPSTRVEVGGDVSFYSSLESQPAGFELQGEGASSSMLSVDGDLKMQAPLSGSGSLAAEGQLTMVSYAHNSADSNLALFGGNVTILGGKRNEVLFKGLIYSKENVEIRGDYRWEYSGGRYQGDVTDKRLRRLELEGAVVAQGRIRVTAAEDVHIRYDENAIKKALKAKPGRPRRLELMWWQWR